MYHRRQFQKNQNTKTRKNTKNASLKDKMGISGSGSGREHTCQCRRRKTHRFDPQVGKIPWRRAWQLTPVFLPGKSHGQRSLAGCSPWGCIESDVMSDFHLL